MESALDQRTRLALEKEHHHLSTEIRRLEAIKMTRWKELLDLNLWHTHDEDNTVKELDNEIDEYRMKQRNITTLIDGHKGKMEERNKGMNRLVSMALKETRATPQISASQSSCVDQEVNAEELDYLFLVKVKKGE